MANQEISTDKTASGHRKLAMVAGCFLLSGFAALIYETVWLRQFSIHFGTSEQSLAIVLGTYMGGLALGSLIASRVAKDLRKPLLVYGLLELGIAVSAMLVPVSLAGVRHIQVFLFGGVDEPPSAGELNQILFAFSGAFAATILPTTMMGATLPMLAKYAVERNEHLGNRIGALYAINTLGAVLGTLTCAFVCLPHLGLSRTILVGATVNLIVFVIVWMIVRSHDAQVAPGSAKPTDASAISDSTTGRPSVRRRRKSSMRRIKDRGTTETDDPSSEMTPRDWILWLILLSGAVSFAYEIIFTRMIGHFLGGSVFSFAAMLASFLLGIAIGGGIAARFARRGETSAIGFYYAQCGTAMLALMSWHCIESLAGQINRFAELDSTELIPRVLCAIVILLPPAVTIGMTFPWAIRIHARDARDAAPSSAKVYAWNTVGGVLGAFLTGTYLLPLTNYQMAMAIALSINLFLAICMFIIANPRRAHLALLTLAVITAVLFVPSQPDELLRVSSFENYVRTGELTFAKTGRSATVTTHNTAGTYAFSTNGLPEAGTRPKGAMFDWDSAPHWLGVLPALLRPQAKTMLVVGFGGGVAPAHAPRSVASIDVFELEEAIIEANQLVATKRSRDPLSDRRIHIILNDGRSGLALTSKKYDAIVSQPSHPWTAGASHLYTREFAELTRDHLTDDGVFLLWMDCQFVDVRMFRSLAATLGEAFSHISLFRPNKTTLIFVGSMSSLEIPMDMELPKDDSDREMFEMMGIHSADALTAVLALDDASLRKLCQGAQPTTDNNNLLALRQLDSSSLIEQSEGIFELINRHDPLARPDTTDSRYRWVDRVVLAERRYLMGRPDNAALVADGIGDESDRWFAKALLELPAENLDRGLELCWKSVQADPSNEHAWVLLFMLSRFENSSEIQTVDYQTAKGKVTQPYAAIVDAIEMMRTGQTENMKSVDAILATIPPTDRLFGAITMLRIQWRDADATAGTIQQRGSQNLRLINLVTPYTSKSDVLMFRLKAAMFANQPLVVLATAKEVSDFVRTQYRPRKADKRSTKPVSLEELRIKLLNCLTAIASIETSPMVPATRYHGVRMYVQNQLHDLEASMSKRGP